MPISKIKILTVDDDNDIAEMIGAMLAEAGYDVIHFFDANGAIEWLKTHKPDLIVSDVGLPGISGVQFCDTLKKNPSTSAIPVIMLSSYGDAKHKVNSLKTGADDYVVKPFLQEELLARIEALLRRCYHRGAVDKVLVYGELALDIDKGSVSIRGKKISLLPKEFSLLSMFLSNQGRLLGYRFIAESVWGFDSIATKDTIKVTIHRLKSKLGPYADCIQSALGQGYKWSGK